MNLINCQAPDVPELAHQGIFQLSRLSVSCYVKTMKKYPLHLNLTDFMKILYFFGFQAPAKTFVKIL